ncbi:histidine phosphatase family protein [Asaia lannensis]|uniref:Histidine phosphatase family protein n=1 Tax=Asaia lannensis NBRC 102526 TaxID=1307926 RepID=A0ABT1CDK7_9PROT|nr:histidine phosphatase family protein [Asaia lannensis]MCO6158944.1 histidine phosphatase family protein [Asaia lannensis NBRC 102526]GBQ96455.1 phosphohistidine phosphatase SixA [Asaia lannensis NBRC 102526]
MTTHHLILVRHAQAAPETLGGSDRLRPLTTHGMHDAEHLGEKLAALDIDLAGAHLWHSTATRTTQTATAIAAHLPETRVVHGLDALYDLDPYGILELLRETPETIRTLVLIGHNPAIAETCLHLASNAVDGPVARELMRGYEPGTAAVFTIASDWIGLSPNTATLGAVLRP